MPAAGDVRTAARQRAADRREQTGNQPGALSGKALAIRDDQEIWDPNQLAAMDAIGVQSATPADLALFFYYSQRTGLSPFLKQIYMIRRWSNADNRYKQTIQVGIDGFRIVRDRAADRGGWTAEFEETLWYDSEGIPTELWLKPPEEPPFACKVVLVKVFPDGVRARVPHMVRYDAYADVDDRNDPPTPKNRWKNDAPGMLAKCAEAGASRKAAPNDLSGLYVEEEMTGDGPHPWRQRPTVKATVVNQEETPAAPGAPEAAVPVGDDPDAEAQRKAALARMHAMFRAHNFGDRTDQHHAVRVAVAANFAREAINDPYPDIGSTADLNVWQAERVAERLEAYLKDKADGHKALARMARTVAQQISRATAPQQEDQQ